MTTDNLATRCDMRHGEQNVPNEHAPNFDAAKEASE